MDTKQRIIAVLVVIVSLFGLSTPAQAAAISTPTPSATAAPKTNIFTAPFKFLFQAFEAKKENKEANKNLRNEIIERQVPAEEVTPPTNFANVVSLLSHKIDKMDYLADRVDLQIQKTKDPNVDLELAQNKLDTARAAIARARKIAIALTSTTGQGSIASTTEDVIDQIAKIKTNLESITTIINSQLVISANKAN